MIIKEQWNMNRKGCIFTYENLVTRKQQWLTLDNYQKQVYTIATFNKNSRGITTC